MFVAFTLQTKLVDSNSLTVNSHFSSDSVIVGHARMGFESSDALVPSPLPVQHVCPSFGRH